MHMIVLRDVMRRKRRVLYAAIGVVIGTMTIVAIMTIALAGQQKIYSQLEKYGANLNVVPAAKNLETGLGNLNLGSVTIGENYIFQDKIAQIRQIADGEIRKAWNLPDDGIDITTIAPKLYLEDKIKGITLTLVGIVPSEEERLKTWWQLEEGKYPDGDNQVLLGTIAAGVLQIKINDIVELNNTVMTVTGILDETGSDEDYQAFIPLSTLQHIYGKEGQISVIDIRALCNACPAEVIAEAINKDIPGLRAVAVQQIAAAEMGMLDKIKKFMLALAGVTLVVGGFGVVNTLMTSINERVKDISIMRAVGAARSQIILMQVIEAIIIGTLGGVFGYIFGTLLAYIIGPLIFEGVSITPVIQYFPVSLVIAVLIAVLATLYPAFRATRIRVADSFRSL